MKNRRPTKFSQLCKELKSLTRQFKQTTKEEKGPLTELRTIIRKKLITLRRAESHRRKARERAKKKAAFIANPFAFCKQLLGQKNQRRPNGVPYKMYNR